MVGINPRLVQNYQVQRKKVTAQDEGNKQQQTQQAETQAVKQPAVPILQQPTVKVPLENLQLNAGIINQSTKVTPAKQVEIVVKNWDECLRILQNGNAKLDLLDRIYIVEGNKTTIVEIVGITEYSDGRIQYRYKTYEE